jgi:threonine/homoserine/homoserine lactone efflux protein
MNSEVLLAYIVASVIIVSIPGPNVILIINDSVKYGFKQSLLTILGITTGTSCLFLISLSGLTALLSLFSSIFTIIKWIGVCYLIYLGIAQIISSLKEKPSDNKREGENNNLFFKGFLVSVTNPKGLLFAAAFFPQFLNKQLAIGPQIMILCGGFLTISFIIESTYAYASDTTGRIFETENFRKLTERISGIFLIIFGVGLSFVKKGN